MADRKETRPQTDQAISNNLQQPVDYWLLGASPRGAMLRIVGFIAAFILIGGMLMALLNPLT